MPSRWDISVVTLSSNKKAGRHGRLSGNSWDSDPGAYSGEEMVDAEDQHS